MSHSESKTQAPVIIETWATELQIYGLLAEALQIIINANAHATIGS